MIQTNFIETYGLGHLVHPEFPVRGGSKAGLVLATLETISVDSNSILGGLRDAAHVWLEGRPTGNMGWVDIVDKTTFEAFEIKNEKEILLGIAEINWYISKYAENPCDPSVPLLIPGINYMWTPGWELIGTNPYYPGGVIVANMQAPGAITYKSIQKDDYFKDPRTKPVYVWDWDPATRTVKKRRLDYVYNPCPSPSLAETARDAALITGGIYALWRVGKVVLGFVVAGPLGAAVGAATP
jgi:hypothetical protein